MFDCAAHVSAGSNGFHYSYRATVWNNVCVCVCAWVEGISDQVSLLRTVCVSCMTKHGLWAIRQEVEQLFVVIRVGVCVFFVTSDESEEHRHVCLQSALEFRCLRNLIFLSAILILCFLKCITSI